MKNLKQQLMFWLPNGAMLLLMVGSGIMYLMQPAEMALAFEQLGYPGFSMYFNAAAKILGGIAIAFPVSRTLKEFAYAGYLYIMLMATQAIWIKMSPANAAMMFVFIGIWALAYWQYRKRV